MDFAHLHVHAHSSAFDGLGVAKEFADRAAEMGQRALALTDHGSLRGLYEMQKACDAAGIKFVPGVEAYVVDDATQRGVSDEFKDDLKRRIKAKEISKEDAAAALKAAEGQRRDRDHVTLWALTQEGLGSLYQLMSWAWTEGFYYKSRIDLVRLAQFSEGLAASTGCPTGMVPSPLSQGRADEAERRAEVLRDIFGDRLYVEIMPHHVEGGQAVNGQLLRIARRIGAKVVATQDAHYPRAADYKAHDVLLTIQTRDTMSNPGRFSFKATDFWLRSREEMEQAFSRGYSDLPRRDVWAALDETVALAERCSARVLTADAGAYLAAPEIPPEFRSYDDWLAALCVRGLRERFGQDVPEEYVARLVYELDTVAERGFSAYFLVVWDMICWARQQGIYVAPGRGSAAGCLISYLTGIVEIDPLVWGLRFERFIAPGRKSLPDIDTDFCTSRRGEVVEYLRGKYGEDRVAQISTVGRFGAKSLIHDIARVYEISRPMADAVARALDRHEEGGGDEELAEKPDSLPYLLSKSDAGREFVAGYPEEVDLGARLQGQMRNSGVHPAGVAIASRPLVDLVPIETRGRGTGERVKVVAYDKKAVEDVGLVKLDILGTTILDVLGDAAKAAGVVLADIPYEDDETLMVFNTRRFSGIFQFDSSLARRLARKFLFREFRDVAVFVALNRPGPLDAGLSDDYVARQRDPALVVGVHPIYDEVTAGTLGILIFQEQVVDLAVRLAGFSPVEADALRAGIAQKTGVDGFRESFVLGCRTNGLADDVAETTFNNLVMFGQYAFNMSHSFAYGRISWQCAWMKAHRAPQYIASLLAHEADDKKRVQIAAEARRLGIAVVPPDVSQPVRQFTAVVWPEGWQVVGALDDVKGVGPVAAKVLVQNAPYRSLVEMRQKLAHARFSVAQFEALAQATAFRRLFPHYRLLTHNAREIWQDAGKGVEWQIDPGVLEDLEPEAIARMACGVYPLYADAGSKVCLDGHERRIRAEATRDILAPSDLSEDDSGGRFVLAAVETVEWRFNDKGDEVARVSLLGADGLSVAAKAYWEPREEAKWSGRPVVALLWRGPRGGLSVDSMIDVESPSPVLSWMLRPTRTRPHDPMTAFLRTPEDGRFVVQGMVSRCRVHRDKAGNQMATITLVGEAGCLRFFVFARTYGEMEGSRELFNPGSLCQVRLRKLSADACALLTADSICLLDD